MLVGKTTIELSKDMIDNECYLLAETLKAKNQDYGNSVQDQFREYGLTSILIRLDDKLKRLKNLRNSEALVDESILDTLKDLAGYATLGSICLQIESEEKEIQFKPVEERETVITYEDLPRECDHLWSANGDGTASCDYCKKPFEE